MRGAVAFERIGRLAFLLACSATSLYALLAFVPFTAIHFLSFRHFTSLALFVRFHELLVATLLAWAAAPLVSEARSSERSRRAVFILAALVTGTLGLAVAAPLRGLAEAGGSPWLPFLWLLPPALLAFADLGGSPHEAPPGAERTGGGSRIVAAATLAAVLVAVFHAAAATLLRGEALDGGFVVGLGGSLRAHLFAFVFVALGAAVLAETVRALDRPWRLEVIAAALPLAVLVERGVRLGILLPISFVGDLARLYAVAIAAVVALSVAGMAFRGGRGESAAGRVIGVLSPTSRALPATLWLGAIAVLEHALSSAIAPVDWNGLVQRGLAFVTWLLVFAAIHQVLPEASARRERLAYAAALAVAALHVGFAPMLALAGIHDAAAVVARRAERDPSLALAATLVRAPSDADDTAFYAFLQAHTNLPRSTVAKPPDVRIVDALTAREGRRPHVFFVVVDSLRQDYLAPYESRVDFTPEIARFAADSVVFRNAFTRYGATGLSEPSIWVGGTMLHLQYVQPFAPMNALAALLRHENYRVLVSLDSILRVILPPELGAVDVDAEREQKDFGLCVSLAGVEAAIDAAKDDPRPIFVYTQPQDLHVSVRHQQGDAAVDDHAYPPPFHAPYASRIRRLDRCFGEFLDGLRRRGLYDDSLVVLASDHGDSLGEGGRWGHAYTLVPEVVRIPMIVHLPPRLRAAFSADENAVASSADLTPTLYRLLGHGPIRADRLLGRPLFAGTEERHAPLRDRYLLASSYGPVYGLLSGDGRELYVTDAVAFEDVRYDLSRTFLGERLPIAPEHRATERARIREEILAIERAYGLESPSDASSASKRRASS